METSFLRALNELYFSVFPTGFFLDWLNLFASLLNGLFGLFGIDSNIVAF